VKLPRDISGEQAVKALKGLGFTKVRQTGSHIRLSKGTTNVTVPNHQSIAPGTLLNIFRQAGIEIDEFLSAL
jgi:predicted RNA binding protein YcfA (HicA-like mRNA interferase family)